MAYDDGKYFGRCKLICTSVKTEDNGKQVMVTDSKGKVTSNTLAGLKCEFMLDGRDLYKVQLVANGVAEYTTEVEAGYGECIQVYLEKGHDTVKQNELLDLNTINYTANLQYKGASAQALKDVNNKITASGKNFIFDYRDGKYGFNTSESRGADTFHPFSDKFFVDLSGKGTGSGGTYKYDVKSYYDGWAGLTRDNFNVALKSMPSFSDSISGYGWTWFGVSASFGGCTPSYSYDASSGILTVQVSASITMSVGQGDDHSSHTTPINIAESNLMVILTLLL